MNNSNQKSMKKILCPIFHSEKFRNFNNKHNLGEILK